MLAVYFHLLCNAVILPAVKMDAILYFMSEVILSFWPERLITDQSHKMLTVVYRRPVISMWYKQPCHIYKLFFFHWKYLSSPLSYLFADEKRWLVRLLSWTYGRKEGVEVTCEILILVPIFLRVPQLIPKSLGGTETGNNIFPYKIREIYWNCIWTTCVDTVQYRTQRNCEALNHDAVG
jgi:hypothetical protein